MSEDISIIEKAAVAIEEIAITIEAAVVIEEIVIITEEVAVADRHYKRSPFGGSNYYKRRGRSSS